MSYNPFPPPKRRTPLHGSVIIFLVLAAFTALVSILSWIRFDPNAGKESNHQYVWDGLVGLLFGAVTCIFLLIALILHVIFSKK